MNLNLIFSFCGLVIFLPLWSQPLELTDQNGARNQYTDAIWLDENSFVVSESVENFPYSTASKLKAYDISGELLWQSVSLPYGVSQFLDLDFSGDTAIAVGAHIFEACDYGNWSYAILNYSMEGQLMNEIQVGLPYQNDFAVLPWGYAAMAGDSISHFAGDGTLTQSYVMEGSQNLFALGEFLVVKKEDNLIKISHEGIVLDSLDLFQVDEIASNREYICLLYGNNVVKTVDENLTFLGESQLDTPEGNYELVEDGDGFGVYNQSSFVYLNAQAELLDVVAFPFINDFNHNKPALGEAFCILVGAKYTYSGGFFSSPHHYGAMQIASRSGEGVSHYPDLEILSVAQASLSFNSPEPVVTYYQGSVSVVVRNAGDVSMDGFYLAHGNGVGNCVPDIARSYYAIPLAPGEETSVTLSGLNSWHFSEEGANAFSICVSVSSEGFFIDRDESNDEGCLEVVLSTENISSNRKTQLYPNPASALLRIESDIQWDRFRIRNLSGQLVEQGTLESRIMSVANLDQGFYLIELYNDHEQFISKVMIIQ